jgi:polygalacturonase
MNIFISMIFMCFVAVLLIESSTAVDDVVTCSSIVPMKHRTNNISITEFGGVGDGVTLNTKAFRKAIYQISHLDRNGGTILYIPAGIYLTGSFNLTSHMTLFLAKGAVIKATQDIASWPLMAPLPSYGRGRELPGGRYVSLIHGDSLQDVMITGDNGTIDGQGDPWWNLWKQKTLLYTRPSMIEFVHSNSIIISNVVIKNSPFWNLHPVYCSDVVIRYVTILAPSDSPNTDGIDPDSSSNICIEDSYISTGDDLVAVKSGWDEYGISYNRPSSDITIRRLSGSSPYAGIAIGSETSGGVANILVENITLSNMGIGLHVKTNIGRGGFIRNITISNVYMENVQKGIRVIGSVGDHPDEQFNPNALPVVEGVKFKNIVGVNVKIPGSIQGIKDSPFSGVCLSNVNLQGANEFNSVWKCSDVSGGAVQVSPSPCTELTSTFQTQVLARFLCDN